MERVRLLRRLSHTRVDLRAMGLDETRLGYRFADLIRSGMVSHDSRRRLYQVTRGGPWWAYVSRRAARRTPFRHLTTKSGMALPVSSHWIHHMQLVRRAESGGTRGGPKMLVKHPRFKTVGVTGHLWTLGVVRAFWMAGAPWHRALLRWRCRSPCSSDRSWSSRDCITSQFEQENLVGRSVGA